MKFTIDYAINLKSINWHTFTSVNSVTKVIRILYISIINSPPNYDIFLVLSSFINLEWLQLIFIQLSEIPSYAFRPVIGIQRKSEISQSLYVSIKKK
jgi:hypothetical protein